MTIALKDISKRIVNACLQVEEGESIHISAWEDTFKLASNLAIECYNTGAVPLITLITDDLFEHQVTEVPVETLTQPPTHELALAESIDGLIKISGPSDPTILEAAEDDRFSALGKVGAEIGNMYERRNVRQVNVHLGKVTRTRATRYNFEFAQWKQVMENAVLVDYHALTCTGKRLIQQISSGKQVQVRTAHTDLTFSMSDLFLDDIVVSKKDVAEGHLVTNLPRGILELFPQEKSGEGVLTVDTLHRLGKIIKKARVNLKQGKVTSVTAEQNAQILQKAIDRICTKQPVLNRVGIGLNSEMTHGYLFDEICRGSVSIGIGSKEGKCVISGILRKPTLSVDEKTLIERGTIQM